MGSASLKLVAELWLWKFYCHGERVVAESPEADLASQEQR